MDKTLQPLADQMKAAKAAADNAPNDAEKQNHLKTLYALMEDLYRRISALPGKDSITLNVVKLAENTNSTLSALSVSGQFLCFILEDGYRAEKVPGVTRIPGGTYQIVKRTHGRIFDTYSKKLGVKWVPELVGVPNYTDILIHPGNTVKDTRGCLLPGAIAVTGSEALDAMKIQNSTEAFLKIYDTLDHAFGSGKEVYISMAR